jgi:glyoxylase-like metal-dependent hydrolase (beta-lactamase superfamily II)
MMFGSALLLLASLLNPAPQAPFPPPITVDKVADDFYVVRGEGGNTSVYITDEGVILVDPKFERNHADLIANVRALSNQPITYVFNTHAHEDHTGGNVKLAPAVIVGHMNQREIMLKRHLSGVPQLTYGAELRINLGGKEAVARYFGRCHTGGDSFIFFPARRVLATGDCITRGNGRGVPNPPTSSRILIDYDNGGSFTEAIKTVEQVLKLDFDTVVPGHGPLGTKADVVRWHEGLQRLRNRVSALLREGKGRDAVLDVLVKEFEWDPNSVADRANGLMNELKP